MRAGTHETLLLKAVAKSRHGFKNRILQRLSRSLLEELKPHLTEVTLERRDSIYEPGDPFRHVYFPESAMISLMTVLQDGRRSEVAAVGSEGMVGLPVFLGGKISKRKAFCQMPGTAWRLAAAELVQQTRHGGPLSDILHRYTEALLTLTTQLATCNRLHTIAQRCCCWLLMTHDRVEGDEFHVTHEFLSEMLSARRAGVTVVANQLQGRGLIEYHRGLIRVCDRAGLEKAACECYGIVRQEFDRLLGE